MADAVAAAISASAAPIFSEIFASASARRLSAAFAAFSLASCVIFCAAARRSEEHTSELQSLMRISYAVFCLKKKKEKQRITKIRNYRVYKSSSTAQHNTSKIEP